MDQEGNRFEVVSPRGRKAGLSATGLEPAYYPERVVLRGSYDEVIDFFDERLWIDGLPIVPPTISRIERMLAHTARHPAEVIGVVGDEQIEATVWNTAVNAVMAGCRDQDLPIVLAIVEMLVDPAFRIRDAGSTTGWEVLVVLSGPDLVERGFNTETGVMRLGRRANTSIGRFTRLWIRNLAGLLTPPGFTDMAAIGQSFHVAMAESEVGVRNVRWPSCREEWGYQPEDIVVAIQGVVAVSAPIYSSGGSPEPHLQLLGEAIGGCSGHFAGHGANTGRWAPLLAINPAIAEVFARHGMTKDDLRYELAKQARVPARWLNAGAIALGFTGVDFVQRIRDGLLPAHFHESDDPERLVSAIIDPAQLAIVVTGNPGRNQSKYYVPLGQPGQRMSRRVVVGAIAGGGAR